MCALEARNGNHRFHLEALASKVSPLATLTLRLANLQVYVLKNKSTWAREKSCVDF